MTILRIESGLNGRDTHSTGAALDLIPAGQWMIESQGFCAGRDPSA